AHHHQHRRQMKGIACSTLVNRGTREYVRLVTCSVRHNADSLCHVYSRERVKGARRRPLNHPGSRQKGSRKGKHTASAVAFMVS
ncbi:hypothetical protein, partial [Cronobacter sakazakii]|uniref:hypothetical protein n=1 Tax=Cronobacter sakazakii TaxID=28141 RepID=UPI002810CAA7